MSPDEQEALSRKHSNDVIRILRLRSGRWAVFNTAGQLCGIADTVMEIFQLWKPPTAAEVAASINLEELGFLIP